MNGLEGVRETMAALTLPTDVAKRFSQRLREREAADRAAEEEAR